MGSIARREKECGELRFEEFRANLAKVDKLHVELQMVLMKEGVHNGAYKTACAVR